MMFDKQNCFSWKQSVVGAIGAVIRSSFTIDLGSPGKIALPPLLGTEPSAEIDIGKGEEVQCLIMVNEAVVGATTVQAILSQGTGVDVNGDINAGEVTLFDSGAIAAATLIPGYYFKFRAFYAGTKLRYLQLRYVVGAAATTAGKITAGIIDQRQTNNMGL